MTPALDGSFASSYRAARKRLLDVASAGHAVVDAHQHPGPSVDNHSLYTDVVRVGVQNARRILLIISGTHGIEGFAGSALQIACLQDLQKARMPDDTAVILVHALNPYGFAWFRRVDDENVDVNRNFIEHDAEHPENPDYEALHTLLCPADWNETTRRRVEQAIIDYQARCGRTAAETVLTRGQYRHANGLFFGGRAPSWSSRLLQSVLAGLTESAERVTLLDIHTGLGPYGACQLICGVDRGAPRAAAIHRWLGDGAIFFGPATGFERLPGAIDSASEHMLPDTELTPITVEFGTLPALEVLQALCADNWLHSASSRPDLNCAIKQDMRRAFYPDDADWRDLVLVRGRQVIARALNGLCA